MINYARSSSKNLRRVWLALGFLAFCALPFSAGELDLHDPVRQINISLADETSERVLLEIGLELQAIDHQTKTVRAIANTYELGQLDQRGFKYTVEIEDLQVWYAARIANDSNKSQEAPALGQWLSPPFGQGSMGNYYTLSETISVIHQIRNAYPSIVASPRPIGSSLEGRRIWALSISDNPGVSEGEPEVRMDAIHHAREPMSMHTMIWYMLHLVENYGTDPIATYLVDHREQWFIPVVNPDGYAYNQTIAPNGGGMWRKNRRNNAGGSKGVDLNRNYDAEWGYDNAGSSPSGSSNTYRGTAPGSEPEVAAMIVLLTKTLTSSHL